jgi:AraC-like DNA-binding protein
LRKYTVVRREAVVERIEDALVASGGSIVTHANCRSAPFEITIRTPTGETLDLVCYAFTANEYRQGGRPPDEHRFQIKYGSDFDRYHNIFIDPEGHKVTLMFGVHVERGLSRRLDERVTKVLTAIRASDDLRMSIEAAAAMAFLSPGRFAHLFKQQIGLPFRRYMLWRKLTRAMLAIGRERTIAAAAHASDFADTAHLTRTFYQMFGIPPSVMMRGEFFEIPSPFRATG